MSKEKYIQKISFVYDSSGNVTEAFIQYSDDQLLRLNTEQQWEEVSYVN